MQENYYDGRGRRDTSREAYAAAKPEMSNQERLIFVYLNRPSIRRSRAEIAEATSMRLSAVCGRVNSLIKSGVLEDETKIVCSITRKSVHGVAVKKTTHNSTA